MKQILYKAGLFILGVLFAFVVSGKAVSASEGTVEMRSTTNSDFACYAASVQMMDLSYKVLITCRNLLYPSGDDIFNYTLWATPQNGGNPIKFGSLGFGRAEFGTKTPFSELYVTTEGDGKAKLPTGPIVMRGNVEKIGFFNETDTTSPDEPKVTPTDDSGDENADTTPTPSITTGARIVAGLKRAAFVSFLALASLIGLIFVLTRSK